MLGLFCSQIIMKPVVVSCIMQMILISKYKKGGEKLRDLTTIAAALEIVEERLCEPMNAADLAKACFLSYSGLQKLYGYATGDIIIAEAFVRIERELSDDMLLFRTGGDEFAVVTAYKDVLNYQKALTLLGSAVDEARKSPDRVAVYAG